MKSFMEDISDLIRYQNCYQVCSNRQTNQLLFRFSFLLNNAYLTINLYI